MVLLCVCAQWKMQAIAVPQLKRPQCTLNIVLKSVLKLLSNANQLDLKNVTAQMNVGFGRNTCGERNKETYNSLCIVLHRRRKQI